MKYGTYAWYEAPAADGGQKAEADIHYRQTQIENTYECVFSVQYVPSHTVPNVCSQQLFYKQSEKKKQNPYILAKAASDARPPQGTIELFTT